MNTTQTVSTEQAVEILAAYESWKEDTLLSDPDVSLTAYIKVLEAGQPDPRIAGVHSLAVSALDRLTDPDYLHNGLPLAEDALRVIAKLTDTTTHEVEEFTF